MELKANELRIGNYVYDDYSGAMEVDSITNNYIDLFKIGFTAVGRFYIKDIKPIALTEELILKYGKNSIFSNGYSYRITKLGRVEILLGVAIITVIDYLHEFQNLNFALLGCEIEEYKPLY